MKNRHLRNEALVRRIERLVEKSINLVRKLPRDSVNRVLGTQCLEAITSFGANYEEACVAESLKDFIHKMRICLKEVKEARYWLKLLLKANPQLSDEIIPVGKEVTELAKIFNSILGKFKTK